MESNAIIAAIALLAVPLALATVPAADPVGQPVQLAQTQTGPLSDSVDGRVLTDAPVPERLGGVSPAERAGSTSSSALDAGPVNGTPFSGTPTPEHGTGGPAERADPAGSQTPLPNLGR